MFGTDHIELDEPASMAATSSNELTNTKKCKSKFHVFDFMRVWTFTNQQCSVFPIQKNSQTGKDY